MRKIKKLLPIALVIAAIVVVPQTFAQELSETAIIPTNWGPAFAVFGAFAAAALGGIGSTLGTQSIGKASAAIISEKPETFGKLIVLTALPSSQAIYGLVGAFMIATSFDIPALDISQGVQVFLASLPVALTALFSGIYQGKVAAAGANIIAKGQGVGSAVIIAAMVETFAIFGLLISLFLISSLSASF